MKSKTKVLILLALVIFFLFSGVFNSRFSKNIIANDNYLEFNEKNQIQIKHSGFWNLTYTISIDDSDPSKNWSYTASHYDWCSGSGNWTDPYIIENVTIDAQGSDNCIGIRNSNVFFIIRNCTLYNSSFASNGAGINLNTVENGKIINNNCSDNENSGIQVGSSDNNTIWGNIASNNSFGIRISNSNNNTLSENNVSSNYNGIHLYYSKNNTLTGNNASNNTERGIYIDDSDNNIISGNTAIYNTYKYAFGIFIWDSDNNIVSGNTANNNGRGIHLTWSSDNNTISRNNASNNILHGIFIFTSSNNTISENNVSNNAGILGESNAGIGIGSSYKTTISGNTISNNSKGIVVDSDCDNNTIFLNYFVQNEIYANDNGINTKWDNGTIGNYWYDYVGVDANHDGIGDTPYIIPGTAGSQDNFPIWTDNIAPVFTIILPLPDSIYRLIAPNYNITIDELNLDTIWYTLDRGGTNYTITSLTGILNQTAWEALSEGSVTIRFYANDTSGNIGFKDVEVTKDLDAVPKISFGNYYILFTLITILSLINLAKQKKKKVIKGQSYHSLRKLTRFTEAISLFQ